MDDRSTEHALIAAEPLDRAADGSRGEKALWLHRLEQLALPAPAAVVLGPAQVQSLAAGAPLASIPPDVGPFVSIRASAERRAWGGPAAMLNVGVTDANLPQLRERLGAVPALEAYRRCLKTYGVRVCGLDASAFDGLVYNLTKSNTADTEDALVTVVGAAKALIDSETGTPFPDCPMAQVMSGLRAMAAEWTAPSARILRQTAGAPDHGGLSLIVQRMVFGLGDLPSGTGSYQAVDSGTGHPAPTGRYLPNAQGHDAGRGARVPHRITEAERKAIGEEGASLEAAHESGLKALAQAASRLTSAHKDIFEIQFTFERKELSVLDAEPVSRSLRAAINIAVSLAEADTISKERALLSIDPVRLTEMLHPQIDPLERRDRIGSGLAASPGAATGVAVFSAQDALARRAAGEQAILIRLETTPDDIRGMHAASGVVALRGGMTSHAAVIARGLGVPCVVGLNGLMINQKEEFLQTDTGRRLKVGDPVTIDGTAGEILAGAPKLHPATASPALDTLMTWADQVRSLMVRANADTPADAAVARRFGADGIGLCRTEHMFFDESRVTVMREMILATDKVTRQSALDRLLPMQRADFAELFHIMAGLPVTIRLLDPPLHEFLPQTSEELAMLAKSLGRPVDDVLEQAGQMREVNPMLGKRGVRVGVTTPEIYEMQARAIFEAAESARRDAGAAVEPEIMIPLVSANREVEIVRECIDRTASTVAEEKGITINYKVGVMVETPRGALRAGDLARSSAFLSFGTNDLTQMTYGLSRDDAGRFMRDYVARGVFAEDPFHSLDLEGVGELLVLASRRGREARPDLILGLCGEHGGDPEAIRFCHVAGMNYVSCSPYRVPIARLAAAQAHLLSDGHQR